MTDVPKRAAWSGAVAVVILCPACPSLEPVDHCCSASADRDDSLFCDGAETCDGCLCDAGTPPGGTQSEDCPGCDETQDACADPCFEDADCDDSLFCNGLETCDGGLCHAGTPPCGTPSEDCPSCDEAQDACADPCFEDADCDDSLFCNGSETCDGCLCHAGTPPCGDPLPSCSSCDEESDVCIVPECTVDGDCDDGLFCNGVESCDECLCYPGTPPCENDCDEEQDECFTACADDSDCVDGNLCTSDSCRDGVCSKRTRDCSDEAGYDTCVDDAQCNPATGLCELPDGSDPCLSYCGIWHCECLEPDIDQMEGFDARLDSLRCPEQYTWCHLLAGTCQDGTVFLFRDGVHLLAEYFEPQTGAFVGRTVQSDLLEPICCEITYWPRLIECQDAVVTDVFSGVAYEVSDAITLPEPRHGPCLWQP